MLYEVITLPLCTMLLALMGLATHYRITSYNVCYTKLLRWRIAREEIFGPVLVAIPWEDEEEAVRMANDSHYGLAAYVWTHDIGKGLRTAHAIESGWIQINQGIGQSPGHSYGGFKQSGIGREFSLEGMLDSFTQRKSVTVNLEY